METSRCHRGATGPRNTSLELLKSFFLLMRQEDTKGLGLGSEHLGMWKLINGDQEQTHTFFSQH